MQKQYNQISVIDEQTIQIITINEQHNVDQCTRTLQQRQQNNPTRHVPVKLSNHENRQMSAYCQYENVSMSS